jgi:ABC-type polysaccharide/polyol phosphate export permease
LKYLGDKVENVSKFMPLTYVVRFLKGLWIGNSRGAHWLDITVIIGLLIAVTIISTITFKWE